MKYELIKKILNSPITILDYLILEHITNNTAKEFVEDKDQTPIKGAIFGHLIWLKQEEYVSDNNKLTLKGKGLLDQLQKEEVSTDFYSSLHKNLQEKMISLTGKKQKMLQGKYAFLLNEKDLKLRLQKVIKEYQLNDLQKVEKVLLLYIEKCNKARFEYTPTIEYYILKEKSSRLATDYLNDLEEVEQSTSSELLI
jgi:hypothetical protein